MIAAVHSRHLRHLLAERRILIVEDSFLLAEELRCELCDMGAVIVGPAATPAQALELVAREPLDAAILDIRLGDSDVGPVAERLAEARCPFLFLTGYTDAVPLSRWPDVPRVGKPVDHAVLWRALAALIGTGRPRTEGPP